MSRRTNREWIKGVCKIMITYKGDIDVPTNWKDLTRLPELYPGYTPGCHLDGNFNCQSCTSLLSLEGGPQSVGGDFICYKCTSLTSLEGGPQSVGGWFSCGGCTSLLSLEGGPQSVGGDFSCSGCTSLLSLEGAPQSIGNEFYFHGCISLRKPILSIFKIKNLQRIIIDNKQVEKIVNKHLSSKDILECQEELIENGLKEYAKL